MFTGRWREAHVESMLAGLCWALVGWQCRISWDAARGQLPEGFPAMRYEAWYGSSNRQSCPATCLWRLQVREELSFAITQPIAHPQMFEAMGLQSGTGVLLFGPPGESWVVALHWLLDQPVAHSCDRVKKRWCREGHFPHR